MRLLSALFTVTMLVGLSVLVGGHPNAVLRAQTAFTFDVGSTIDFHDDVPGDGICKSPDLRLLPPLTGSIEGPCTLRAAIEEANALIGADVTINVPAGAFRLDNGPLEVGTETFVAGPASITIDGNNDLSVIDGAGRDRVLRIAGGVVDLWDLVIENGAPETSGGGVWIREGARVRMFRVIVRGNRADGLGGGIYTRGSLELWDSTIFGNSATADGGGLAIRRATGELVSPRPTVLLRRTAVTANGTFGSGGGIDAGDSVLLIDESEISLNTSGRGGGGVNATWDLMITNSLLRQNSGPLGAVRIGVSSATNLAFGAPEPLIERTTLDRSTGPAVFVEGRRATLRNSTVAATNAGGDGFAVQALDGAEILMESVTLADSAGGGVTGSPGVMGGASLEPASVTVRNSILTGNSGPNCGAGVILVDANVTLDGSCPTEGRGDLANLNPILAPLGDYGGPTPTYALLPGSPAINRATGDTPSTDQRGFPRVGPPDIGAVEHQGVDADGDGFDSLATGGTDCADADAGIYPGAAEVAHDGIDQDCDGVDLKLEGLEARYLLTGGETGGFTTFSFTGVADTSVADLVATMGPGVDALYRFVADMQAWESYVVGAPEFVNTLSAIQPGDALMTRLDPGAILSFGVPDTIPAGLVTATLEPGFTFLSFTGADNTALADLLAPLPDTVTAVFRFDPEAQQWLAFHRFAPAFVSQLATVDRLDTIFVLNEGAERVDITWFNPQPEPPEGPIGQAPAPEDVG